MNVKQAQEELSYIKEMLEKTKKNTAESAVYFIVWGLVIIFAILVSYALVSRELYQYIWVNWLSAVALGVICTIYINRKIDAKTTVRTYAQNSISYLWGGCGFGFILVSFVLPMFDVISYSTIPILVSLIAGIGVFVSGGIYQYNLFKFCGVLWWIGSIVLIFIPDYYRNFFVIFLLLVGYLMPGFILMRQYKRNGEDNHD